MDVQNIKRLTEEWEDVTDKVIQFENPGCDKVSSLFRETFDLLNEYRNSDLIPKQISALLLQIHDFGWWVSDLEETPLHCYYQEIVSIICELNTYFLTPVTNEEKIIKNISKII
jgi:hypothetical protein